jgi:TRAP-type mannitol/chloroaromatic compound transport system permease small subunit
LLGPIGNGCELDDKKFNLSLEKTELKKLLRIMDGISEWTGRIFSWLILALMLVVVFEVVMRRFFNSPTIWSFEITIQLYALYFMIIASYGLLHNSHVSIEIIYEKFGARTRSVLNVLSYLIFFYPFMFVLMVKAIPYVSKSWAANEKSWSVFAPPLYPIKTIIPLMVLLLLIQGTANFIRHVYFMIKGRELC